MQRNILLGYYSKANSFWHRRDARVKLLVCISYVALLWQKTLQFSWLLFFSTVLIILTIGSRQSIIALLTSIRSWRWFLLITFLININVFSWSTLNFSLLSQGLFFTWRLVLAVWIALWLNWTTKPLALIAGLITLLNPLKKIGLPVEVFSLASGLTLRFFPLLWEEGEKIVKAQKLRGANFRTGSFRQRWFALQSLLIPMLIAVFRRADHLALAIEARGFRIGQPRTYYRQKKLDPADWMIIWVVILFWVVMICPLHAILK